jgi:UDP:flavonoid glycosyltransferase YjiC (YdhE family)
LRGRGCRAGLLDGRVPRRAPLILLASGKPFRHPQTDWGDAVQMIGPCVLDPGPDAVPDWLTAIELPIVLVTTSSEKQADTDLVATAMTALADERVHIVATMPAAQADGLVTLHNQCGTRLPAKKLSPPLLRTKVRETMAMQNGARRVTAGFAATGGTAHGADLFEQRVLGIGAG